MNSETGPVLQARSLNKRFVETTALNEVSLDLDLGEMIALVGASGSGKSALLLCLAGILRPDSGEVRYRGSSLLDMTESELSRMRRTKFGVLFQFGQLIPELTAVENVALPLMLEGSRRRNAEKEARNCLGVLGVEHLADRRPTLMSGGQAQRVAIARAFVTEPEVIFADEPTGALDTSSGEVVMQTLTTMARLKRTSVVLVTHDARVASYADRQLGVEDGSLVDQH